MPRPPALDRDALLAFAHQLADRSGELLLKYFRTPLAVENKAGQAAFDPVTIADQAAEQMMREMVAETWPGHGIVGEEFESVGEEAPIRWVFDPIDGTRAFIIGSPLWGTLVGVLDGGKPILGLMNQPFTGERFWSDGEKSYFRRDNGKPHRLSARRGCDLQSASLVTTDPALFGCKRDMAAFNRLSQSVCLTRYGGDCYNYCMLAAGHVDLVVETDLKPHDIVALIPIIEGAGGVITTWQGGSPVEGGAILAAGCPHLHAQAREILNAH